MSITISCQGCGSELQFPEEFTKRLGMCPQCQSIQTIPSSDAVAQLVATKKQVVTEGKKCPNCFEINLQGANRCLYCNEFLGKYELNEICPNCKEEQPPENQYCRKCGVNMHTGLYDGMVKRRCARCGNVSQGLESVCVVCGTSFEITRAQIRVENYFQVTRKLIAENASLLILLALILGGAYVVVHWQEVRSAFRSSFYGEHEVGLRDAVTRLSAALRYRDWASVQEMMDKGKQLQESDFFRVVGLGKEKPTDVIVEFAHFKITNIVQLKGSATEGSATVYGEIAYQEYPLSKLGEKPPASSLEALAEAAEKLKKMGVKGREIEKSVNWKWVLREGEWKRSLEE